MTQQTPLEKRIKRHVIGREQDFFVATSPGMEKICFEELMEIPIGTKKAVIVTGGVEFKGRLPDCYLANLWLRTASRVLMRMTSFKANRFYQLEQHLGDFPWELYLGPEQSFHIRVATLRSRLYHKEAIAERVADSIYRRFDRSPPAEPTRAVTDLPQQIFVRVVEDRFTLSIDSSGELLYKRGLKTHGGSAPIRENIAAAALRIAGYTGEEPLIDPMSGTGTFSLEAAMMAAGMAPGIQRAFAFMNWPAFRPRQWSYLRREAAAATAGGAPIYASDHDPELVRALATCVRTAGLGKMIRVAQRDFFDFSPSELTDRTGLVALNPPYGIRLGTPEESSDLFQAICDHLKRAYGGWRVVLVAPHRELVPEIPFPVTAHPLYHGGLKLTLLSGGIK